MIRIGSYIPTLRSTYKIGALLVLSLLVLLAALWGYTRNVNVQSSPSSFGSSDYNVLKSGWEYMPGIQVRSDGLRVSYIGRSIVRQDGTPGQQNPSVNLYGTHLQASGNFTLNATVRDLNGLASFRLYNGVPIVQDEFRIEPKSLELALTNTTLTVSAWNGYTGQGVYAQVPNSKKTFNVSSQENNRLTVRRSAGQLIVKLNDQQMVTLTDTDLLGRDIWFGMDAVNPKNTWTLANLQVGRENGVAVVDTQRTTSGKNTSATSLQRLASAKRANFHVGAAMALSPLAADSDYARLAEDNFGTMTTENMLKWQFVHPQPNIYEFHEADALVDIATKHGMSVHGHTLVFGEANPVWIQSLPRVTNGDRTAVRQVMVDHIMNVVGHFKGRVASWDVVNEPLADGNSSSSSPLRQHVWFQAMGESYIADAFKAARQVDQSAKLYINEFGLEADGDRWNEFLTLVTRLKTQNVPIDGVGFEAHVYTSGDEINTNILREHIRTLAKLGLTSRISEMDVHDEIGTEAQALQYGDVFGVCFNEPSCIAWSTWGVTDRYDLSQDENNRLKYGHNFLWDEHTQPTASIARIRQSIAAYP